MLWLMYWLNYLDRNAITLARLNGFQKDLGLTSAQYSTSISILFVGYILGQIPSNMIITRVRPSWYMGICMMGWAVVSGLTAITHNYTASSSRAFSWVLWRRRITLERCIYVGVPFTLNPDCLLTRI